MTMKKAIISILLTCLLFFPASKAYTQSALLDQKATFYFEGISLEDLLGHLSDAYQINFSYSLGPATLGKEMGVEAFNTPLVQILDEICQEAGLVYRVIDDHVVLRKDNKPKVKTLSVQANNSPGSAHSPEQVYDPVPTAGNQDINPIENIQAITDFDKHGVVPIQEKLHKVKTTAPAVDKPQQGFPKKNRLNIAVGPMASYGLIKYNFKERPSANQEYAQEENYGIGISGALWAGKPVAVSMGMLFSKRGYSLDYNYRVANPKDPIAIPETSKVSMSYLEFPVGVDFRIFRTGKLSLYLSPTVVPGFLVGEREGTTYLNAGEKATEYFTQGNKKFLLGGSLGLKLWYSLGRSASIFLKPEYVYCFSPLNGAVMGSDTQLLQIKTGVNFNIKANKLF